MTKLSKTYQLFLFFGALSGMFLSGCKDEEKVFGEPYGEGKPPLDISIDRSRLPTPSIGLPGTEVSINATGLIPFKDQMVLRFNGEVAQVSDVTETGLKAVVPANASTGVISITIGDIVVFGPEFIVDGFLQLDPTFRAVQGANNTVGDVLFTSDGKQILVGGFTDYDNKGIVRPINRIARIFPDGSYDASFRSVGGANGYLGTGLEYNGKLFIGGTFSGYNQRTENISNLTMLNSNGSIDTLGIHPFRRPDQSDTIKYIPRFNGGVDGGDVQHIYQQGGKLIITGGFRYYVSRQYDKPNKLETRDSVIVDSIEVRQIARLNLDGSLDKTYRFDAGKNTGLAAGNGYASTYMHTEGPLAGKMLVFGSFTRFDDQPAGYILRLNADGTKDETFNPGGQGADYNISDATYNPKTRKYMLSGNFRHYNGQAIAEMAMLNEDGTLDNSFVPQTFDNNGGASFVKQLDDGLIVVNGGFSTYGGVVRNNFMILQPNGELAPGYNNTGLFGGSIYNAYETKAEDGKRALLIVGDFTIFNNDPVNHIVRILLE